MDDSEENLWSVLLMTGYLTKADTSDADSLISLRIPNQEIAGMLRDVAEKLFAEF